MGGSCRGTTDQECHMMKTGAQGRDASEMYLVKLRQLKLFLSKGEP